MKNKIKIIKAPQPAQYFNYFLFDWATLLTETADCIAYGYFINQKLFGMINFERQPDDYFDHVLHLEVLKTHRHQNIGVTLLTSVMQDAFDQGFEGYVKLRTKTDGTEQYYLHLGGKFINFDELIFDEPTSRRIIHRYLENGGYHHG